jgi:hypothetical protein
MKLEANDYNLDDKVENYTLCINEGKKMWKKNSEELTEEPYILGDNLYTKNENVKKDTYYSHITKTPSTSKSTKTISIYHQFIKDKIIEYTKSHPNMTKKDRYSLILSEWKKTKSENS